MTKAKEAQAIQFGKFASATPERNLSELPEGWNKVAISRITPITDRIKSLTENTKKDKKYLWDDETPQVAVIFSGKEGTIIHRFNLAGYAKFDELTEAEQKTHTSAGDYAVNMETGRRVLNQKRVDDCQNILNNLFFACKKKQADGTYKALPEGSGFDAIVGCELEVKVEASIWKDKEQKRTVAYRKFSEIPVGEPAEDF